MRTQRDQTDPASDGAASSGATAPLIAIVVVVAVVVAVVLHHRRWRRQEGDAPTVEPRRRARRPTGAITFNAGQGTGPRRRRSRRRATQTTGRVAMPYYFAARVLRQREGQRRRHRPGRHRRHDQGGRVPRRRRHDPILDYITAAIKNDDTNAQVKDDLPGYDRHVQQLLPDLRPQGADRVPPRLGHVDDEVAARADAVKATDDEAVRRVGRPRAHPAWADELAARKVICLGCPGGAFNDWCEQR